MVNNIVLDEHSPEWCDVVDGNVAMIAVQVTELVEELTKDLRPDIDYEVRKTLTRTYGFFR